MSNSEVEIAIIGAGAAGVAAGRRLRERGVDALLIEARTRIGGRAWTAEVANEPLDLGCGWLHSADRNPWTKISEEQGRGVDRSLPPWERPAAQIGFTPEQMRSFSAVLSRYRDRVDKFGDSEPDRAVATFLEPGGQWIGRLDAISTYYSGAELDRVSARDLARYYDSGVNWRVREGYGTVVSTHGADLPIQTGCEAIRVDHRAKRVRIETTRGVVTAAAVIVTLPTALIAAREDFFLPALPDKVQAAADLPLGLADKLFLALADAETFEPETRAFGKLNSVETASYQFRPFGRPLIEAYFGGELAARLELGGPAAFFDFAREELIGLFGGDFGRRITMLATHGWRGDPWCQGSYSFALPGRADSRATLAASVDGRLFFAGEACSKSKYSTAHGAYETGVRAANEALAALFPNR